MKNLSKYTNDTEKYEREIREANEELHHVLSSEPDLPDSRVFNDCSEDPKNVFTMTGFTLEEFNELFGILEHSNCGRAF